MVTSTPFTPTTTTTITTNTHTGTTSSNVIQSNSIHNSIVWPIQQTQNGSTSHQSMFSTEDRLKLDRYSGNDPNISAQRWISLFDVVVSHLTTDLSRVQMLMQYLKSEALDWYADEITPFINSITYQECKDKFARRFGMVIVDPVVSSQRRRLQRGESITDYFNAKMTFLRRSTLTPQSQSAQLTEGMPHHYRPSLIAANPQDTISWLETALRIEESSRLFTQSRERRPNPSPQFNHFTSNKNSKQSNHSNQTDVKPPRPCRFCQEFLTKLN